MSLKRQRNPLESINNKSAYLMNLSITDCTCPICLEILVEPVVLPCKHELCLPCFNGMTDKTNFLCPMCRLRISTWSRTASNSNTLVNMDRWDQIKRAFPSEVKDRIEGKTADKLAESYKQEKSMQSKFLNISKPGDIRQEYETIMRREYERLRAEKVQEEKLSTQYIQQIIAQEERMTVPDYINRINSNTQNLTTSHQPSINSILTRHQPPHTPVIVQPSPAPITVPVIQSRIRLQNQSALASPYLSETRHTNNNSEPINHASTSTNSEIEINSSNSSSSNILTPKNSLVRRISTRSSIKKNLEEVKSIRAHLLTSIAESKTTSVTEELPRRKLRARGENTSISVHSSDESGVNNNSINSDVNESLTVVKKTILPASLKRRGSARLAANKSIANDSLDETNLRTSGLQRRDSLRKRPRQTNL